MSLTRFSQGDIVISTDSLVTSTWSGNTNNLQTAFTSSANNFTSPTSSGFFHLDVYDKVNRHFSRITIFCGVW